MAYNLLSGLKGNVDNAAHIGGLVSGALFGYGAWFSLSEKDELEQGVKQLRNLALSAGVTILIILVVFNTADKKYQLLDQRMQRFARYEMQALNAGGYNFSPIISGSNNFQDSMLNLSMANWKSCERVLDSISRMDLPPAVISRNNMIVRYVVLRKEYLEITKEGLHKGSPDIDKLNEKNRQIEEQMNLLGNY